MSKDWVWITNKFLNSNENIDEFFLEKFTVSDKKNFFLAI